MLQFITHHTPRYNELEGATLALKGGCRWIQLRMKKASAEEIIQVARELRPLCTQFGAKLIIDDHVELVVPTGADGVHVGKMDMPVPDARRLLGDKYIIGATANTLEDIERAVANGADYIGLGPYRFTTTKEKLSPVLGLEGYRDILGRSKNAGIDIPVVAIGGITIDDVDALMQTGITGVAVSGCILSAAEPADYTRQLIEITNK
ncbi:MAG: thiamine phosphate synthase [Muribaculaceae bacterium]|nr:thiamine phosphate synthase [Muribaculaceae bacterium]